MSQNINQIFIANPAASMQSTDLMYLGRSPYGLTNDMAITWANTMSSITTVGTITSGTWHGTVISPTYGGTGINNGTSTITIGGNVTYSGAFTFTGTLTGATSVTFPTSGTLATTSQIPAFPLSLANGGTNANLTASNGGIFWSTGSAGAILSGTATANQVLLSGSNATPAWSSATYPSSTTINQILFSSASNVIGGISASNSAVMVSSSTGVPSFSSTMTNGQVIIGSTGATPTAATITAGTNISVTNGAGTITIAGTGPASFSWVAAPSTPVTGAVNTGYYITDASAVTINVPATFAAGAILAVAGNGAGGFVVQMNTGQTAHLGNVATSSGGTLTSTNQYDCLELICVVANTIFVVRNWVGNITAA